MIAKPYSSNITPQSLFIVGPTASGKSDLAMRIAKKYNGEIICADSQTVRRGLDIGTAKPSLEDRKTIRHHLLDVIDPYENFSVASFKDLASKAYEEIKKRGNLPVIVGGTGLYIDALLYDFRFRKTKSEYSRNMLTGFPILKLQEIIKEKGLPMPENYNNPRHLIRIIESEGQVSKKGKRLDGSVIVGVNPEKNVLEERINNRIQLMLKGGFLEEVDKVLVQYGEPPERVDAIGYKIALESRRQDGSYDVSAIAERFATADKRYARRQKSWFKRNKDIVWFEHPDEAFSYLNNLFSKH